MFAFCIFDKPSERCVAAQQGSIAHKDKALACPRHGHIELAVYDGVVGLVKIFGVGKESPTLRLRRNFEF